MTMTGSNWKKWDLHFHSQSSNDYKDKSTTDQEIIDLLVANNVAVVAITDHHVIDTVRIRNLQHLGKGKITVLPGIEFRAELGGSESIHFIGIFSEQSNIEDIWIKLQSGCGITPVDISSKGGFENIHCDLKETCKLIHDLGGIVTVHAGDKTNTIENITNTLPYKMALKTDLVLNHIDILELGKVEDQNDYNNIVFPAINHRLPMIICSDNHEVKKYSVKQNLWIKAEPTFEGLKQILFEPIYRIHIAEQPPINPPIRINKVTLDFPIDATFENEKFCLAGKREVEFSPNFTCLIGGRGTGKSTILNLIHEKLRVGENIFFKDRKVKDANGRPISIDSCTAIDNDADEKYIEFLSQNEVEDFAQNYQKLTAAVYSRILKRDEEGIISKNETTLKEKLDSFRLHIINKNRLASKKIELEQKQKEHSTYTKIIESFSSPEYKKITEALQALNGILNRNIESKDNYYSLMTDLESILEQHVLETGFVARNLFEIEIEKIVKGIKKLCEETKKINFLSVTDENEKINQEIREWKDELKIYLSGKGLTEENLKDISDANIIVNKLDIEIKKKSEEIELMQKKIDSFNIDDSITASVQYKDELEKQIKNISAILEKLESTSVKPISLQLEFDTSSANDRVFTDFKALFEGVINRSSHKHKGDGILRDILFCIQPKQISDKDIFLAAIRNYYTSSAAKTFLLELFSDDTNFEGYKLICERTFLNYSEYKRIKVLYDTRPIENTSFGQRCTAVLVILLLLGNNPIIIDEPEAHLDSLLISNYLVEVIKDKKQNRQIIFATHNANFVINGDAELIHVLNIDETSQTTTITSTTIENEKTREILIGLEGGKEAFIKRENKYQFNWT